MPRINFDPSDYDDLDLINVETHKGPLKKKLKGNADNRKIGNKKKSAGSKRKKKFYDDYDD